MRLEDVPYASVLPQIVPSNGARGSTWGEAWGPVPAQRRACRHQPSADGDTGGLRGVPVSSVSGVCSEDVDSEQPVVLV